MKYLVLFILSITYCIGYSQDLSKLDTQSQFEWKNVELKAIDSTVIEIIFPVIQNLPFRTKPMALDAMSLFHLVDYNGDQKMDVLYNGWTGGEGEMLHIIKNTGDGFELVQTIFGLVKDLKIENEQITEIEILDYACCDGYVDHLQLWSLATGFKYEAINDLAMLSWVKTPTETFETPIHFRIKNEKYNMRLNTEIRRK